MKSTIKLFKALPIEKRAKKKMPKELIEKTIRKGFILSPEVIANYKDYDNIISLIEKECGLTPEELNSSFHKSWQKVRDASNEKLFFEQIAHYITTYGFESLGVYDESSVFIPREELEIPELKENIKLVVIKGYTKKELKEKALSLVKSGIALKCETIENLCDVFEFVGIKDKDIEGIRNREIKIRLYEELDLIPKNPTEFLRYLIYKNTGSSLIIKNEDLISKIKENPKTNLFRKYENLYGLKRLGEIFYRFKPLFLAFKGDSSNNNYINKIRKLAIKNHKPMELDYLNEITSLIKNSNKIQTKLLKEELSKVNLFRKIRLAYALKYRTLDVESIVYQIRDGKAYSTSFEFKNKEEAKRILKIVVDAIVEDISKNVKGKKIYIPEYINYSLPATEKQFIGEMPIGSYISIKSDMVVGVNWKNVDRKMIDLDLSVRNVDGKVGWDSSYRTRERDMLFSGDMTDAQDKNGATELFYMKKNISSPYTLNLNYYNYDSNVPVQFSIFVASEKITNMQRNYMVNPNNILCSCKSKIDVKNKVLGILVPSDKCTKYYFTDFKMGKTRTERGGESADNLRESLFKKFENQIELKDILKKAGVKFVEKNKAELDLSPESLEKDTIINLLTK